jgi:hypothetical protein
MTAAAIDLAAIRAIIREELAPIEQRLAAIEEQLAQLPNVEFLRRSDVARQVVQALKVAEAQYERGRSVLPVPD